MVRMILSSGGDISGDNKLPKIALPSTLPHLVSIGLFVFKNAW